MNCGEYKKQKDFQSIVAQGGSNMTGTDCV
jgi:hypothetical protein